MTPLTTREAAQLCGVDRRTMLRWVKAELLPAHQTAGGQQRIAPPHLRSFMARQGMPIPEALRVTRPEICIVDDDPVARRAMRSELQRLVPAATVREAVDGFQAGIIVGVHRPELVLLDIMMPGIDGIEVCRRLHEEQDCMRTVEVVAISSRTDEVTVATLRGLGVRWFLPKPLRPGQLVPALHGIGLAVRS